MQSKIRKGIGFFGLTALVACAASQSSLMPVHSTEPQDLRAASHSWMLPEASGDDLIYISNGNATVTVYSWPTGKMVGTLRGFDVPEGECVDKAGDVFITVLDLQEIVEYAHGGKKPIATLSDSSHSPWACSVDPVTGDLAVADDVGIGSTQGLSIYRNAQGKPIIYRAANIVDYGYCSYDDKGNLYVNGSMATAHSCWTNCLRAQLSLRSYP